VLVCVNPRQGEQSNVLLHAAALRPDNRCYLAGFLTLP